MATQFKFNPITGQLDLVQNLSGYVPTTRKLSINGTEYDLSSDRSWTIAGMIYPSSGIAVSTGSAWGTSISGTSSQFVKGDGSLDSNTYIDYNGFIVSTGNAVFNVISNDVNGSAEVYTKAGTFGEHSAYWLSVPFGSNNNQNWRISAYATGSFANRFAIERWSNDRTFIANNPLYIEDGYMSLMRNGGNVTIGGEYGNGRLNIFNSTPAENFIVKNTYTTGYSDIYYQGNSKIWRSGVGNAAATVTGTRNKYFIYDVSNSKLAFSITDNTLLSTFYGANSNNLPVLGATTNAKVIMARLTGEYGIAYGVKDDTGDGWIQAQRFDGTATAYNLLLQPSGGFVKRGIEQSIVSGTFFTQTSDKTVGNTTTETSLVGTGSGSMTLPANTLKAGTTIRVKMKGYVSGVNGDTSTLKIKLGSTELATSTGTWQTLTGVGFDFEFDLTCRTTGATGTVIGQGRSLIAGGQGFATVTMRALTMSTTKTIDTTASQTIDLTYTWGTASASDTITITNLTAEILR